jgi:hypothetical protein
MNNYFDQRARLQYIAKASDDLKLVTHFELDTRFGGITDGKYNGSSDSGGLDADGVSLETKHVYLDFNLGKNFNVKTGVQPYTDTIKGLFINADVPAIVTTTKLGAYTLGLGFSRFGEAQVTGTPTGRIGDRAKDLFIWDNTFAFSKDTKAALSYYFLADYMSNAVTGPPAVAATRDRFLLNTLGLSAETKLGPATLSGFFAMQAGHSKLDTSPRYTSYHGWAANAAAKVAAGPGTAKAAFLFTSGDQGAAGDGHNGAWYSPLNSYNESGMMIIARNLNDAPSTTDNRIRRNISNLALLTMGYDANLTEQVFLNSNVGFAWVHASGKDGNNLTTGQPNGSVFLGTELNVEAGYKVSPNLNLSTEVAYMMLGGLYDKKALKADGTAADPENPYTMRLMAKFKF